MGNERGSMIHIAFCFDSNMMRQACVAIASLLDSRDNRTHFHIYCICTEKELQIKSYLQRIVQTRDTDSIVTFHRNTMDLDKGYVTRGITVSTYYRLNLHRMFPNVKRMLYSDVDILFKGDVSHVWNIDLKDNFLAGVRADVNIKEVWDRHYKDEYWHKLDDWFGSYINAGFILMNFELMRKEKMEEIWDGMHENNYFFQDQDILNITCKPKIMHLPMKYNRMMFYTDNELDLLRRHRVVTLWNELDEALEQPVVVHFAGKKPWNSFSIRGADLWWKYVSENGDLENLFKAERIRYEVISYARSAGNKRSFH